MRDMLLTNNLAYNDLINNKSRITLSANEGRIKTQVLIPVFENKIKEILLNNELLKNFTNKQEWTNYTKFIDWSIIVNGCDFEILKTIINHDLNDVMLVVVENNLTLFENNLQWIEENQKLEKNNVIDLVNLIGKVKLHNSLKNELPDKNIKQNNKINKI